MSKTTGFLEYSRVEPECQPVAIRVQHYNEFISALTRTQAQQQSARCMDCGTPFCHQGCPVDNIIPDFNDLVYRDDWLRASQVLHSTNNFPEFTGRVCPAPCEAACTLNINSIPVGIKSIEQAIVERAFSEGWLTPQVAAVKTGKRVAIVGSGPAGLAAAQQLARAGHAVTVLEKNDQPGGLLRFGIPDFKLEKAIIERRLEQMRAEGVEFRNNTLVGDFPTDSKVTNWATQHVSGEQLLAEFDAVLLAGGAEQSRDLPAPGRTLSGVHFAMEFLAQQNRANAGVSMPEKISAAGKHVIVIGGGDTGADCVGTANRQGALSVTQFDLNPTPPEQENKALTWPYWPYKLRISSSHQEGCEREFAIATQEFVGENGTVTGLKTVRVEKQDGQYQPLPNTEQVWQADLVLLAMGFVNPVASVLDSFGVNKNARGNADASDALVGGYATSVPKVFAAGDMRRGQSLVVWAIREGRQAARAVDEFLMGSSELQLPTDN